MAQRVTNELLRASQPPGNELVDKANLEALTVLPSCDSACGYVESWRNFARVEATSCYFSALARLSWSGRGANSFSMTRWRRVLESRGIGWRLGYAARQRSLLRTQDVADVVRSGLICRSSGGSAGRGVGAVVVEISISPMARHVGTPLHSRRQVSRQR